jgi:thymidylate synthase (FAD)
MEVEILEKTEYPEKVVCTAARNDYEERWVGDLDFEESMDEIEAADEFPLDDIDSDTERRMWTLIQHLLEHGHFGPFEHPHITFAVKGVSRSLMAQITRHRHVSFDIQSMRYVSLEDVDPEPGEAVVEIPALSDPGLTGRNAEFADGEEEMADEVILRERQMCYERAIERAFNEYQNLLDLGVPAQDARMVLPIGTKVNMVFTLNARMLMHVADMRAAADAQWEIREMTEEVLDLAEEWMPLTFTYYNEEMKNRKNRLAP